jgi:hypothetical protein
MLQCMSDSDIASLSGLAPPDAMCWCGGRSFAACWHHEEPSSSLPPPSPPAGLTSLAGPCGEAEAGACLQATQQSICLYQLCAAAAAWLLPGQLAPVVLLPPRHLSSCRTQAVTAHWSVRLLRDMYPLAMDSM